MITEFTLYGGPLDGLVMEFVEELYDGDEFEVPVEILTLLPEKETTVGSSVATLKYSGDVAVYVMSGSPCEPRYLTTKLTNNKQ
jgi:hypothetical protein